MPALGHWEAGALCPGLGTIWMALWVLKYQTMKTLIWTPATERPSWAVVSPLNLRTGERVSITNMAYLRATAISTPHGVPLRLWAMALLNGLCKRRWIMMLTLLLTRPVPLCKMRWLVSSPTCL